MSFTLISIISPVLDAIVVGITLFTPRPAPTAEGQTFSSINLPRALWAVAATSMFFAAKATVLMVVELNVFGLIRLVYLDLVIVAPLIGASVLVAGWVRCGDGPCRRVSPAARALAVLCCCGLPLGVYATFIEPFNLQLETATVEVSPDRAGRGEVTIGVLSDIQTTSVTDYERSAVERLMAESPDIILVTGDLFQGSQEQFENELPALRDLMAMLSAPGGVYLVPGDVDRADWIEKLIEETDVRLVNNEILSVSIKDRRLTLAGLGRPDSAPDPREAAVGLESDEDPGDIRILFAHHPGTVYFLEPDTRVDLVVAGHTHGGQIRLPFFGPPMTMSAVPRRVAAGGLHDMDGRRIYVSRGVGVERGQAPRIRFFAPPEISIITLK